MKKRIFALAWLIAYLFCTLLFPTINRVYSHAADGYVYACIRTDTAYFYAGQKENSGLFLLPKTYFVKVLSAESPYCRIEYLYDSEYTKKLTGYAKKSDLTFVEFTPNEPYLYHVFDVDYTIDGAFNEEDFLDKITVTCAYYGDYKIGSKTYCYVRRGDEFVYIPKPESLEYKPNTEYDDYQKTQAQAPSGGEKTSGEEEGMSAAQIAILITLCLLIPFLAALVLKNSKKSYDTDENEEHV